MSKTPVRHPLLDDLTSFVVGYDVFISYARRDGSGYARALHDALRSRGYRCFLDCSDIQPGETLAPFLNRAIRRSTVVVVVASAQALRSEWVRQEVDHAEALERVIVPVFTGPAQSCGETSELGTRLQRFVYLNDTEASLRSAAPAAALIEDLSGRMRFTSKSSWIVRGLVATVVLLAALTLAASGFGLLANNARKAEAERTRELQRELGRQRLLAGDARAAIDMLAAASMSGATDRALSFLLAEARDAMRGHVATLDDGLGPLLAAGFVDAQTVITSTDQTVEGARVVVWGLDGPARLGVVEEASWRRGQTVFMAIDDDGTVTSWQLAPQPMARPGACAGLLSSVSDHYLDLGASNDGTRLLTAHFEGPLVWATSFATVLWDVPACAEIARLSIPVANTDVLFNQDASRLLTRQLTPAYESLIDLWDASDGRRIRDFPDVQGDLSVLGFEPGGRAFGLGLAVATPYQPSRFSVQKFSAEDGQFIASMPVADPIGAAAYSPARPLLAMDGDGLLVLGDLADGATPRRLAGHRIGFDILAIDFSADGKYVATAGEDGAVNVWQIADGRRVAALAGHIGAVVDVAFDPAGERIVSAGSDGVALVREWRASPPRVSVLAADEALAAVASDLSSGSVFAMLESGALVAWNVSDGTQVRWELPAPEADPEGGGWWGLDIVADGTRLIAQGPDSVPRLLDATSGAQIARWAQPPGEQSLWIALAIRADGRQVALISGDGHVYLYDPQSGSLIREWVNPQGKGDGESAAVLAAAFLDDRSLLQVSEDGSLTVSDAVTGDRVARYRAPDEVAAIVSLALAESMLVLLDDAGLVWRIELDADRGFGLLDTALGPIRTFDLSVDGARLIVAGAGGRVEVHDLSGQQPRTDMYLSRREAQSYTDSLVESDMPLAVHSVTLDASGTFAAIGHDDGTVRIWSLAGARLLAEWRLHGAAVSGLEFTSDNRHLVSYSVDGSIVLRVLPDPQR